jgi:hypothetical protein
VWLWSTAFGLSSLNETNCISRVRFAATFAVQFITRLDEAAEQNPARNLKIIPLQKASASRIEEALQRILHSRPSRSARP